MDEDIDMDAPQISTLREEETPPPQRSNPRFRVKLVVKDRNAASSSSSSLVGRQVRAQMEDEVDDDDEDQEDQLIDDDDDVPMKPATLNPIVLPPLRSTDLTVKRKSPAKRRPRKSDKRPSEEGRLKEKVMVQPGGPNLAPTMSWFEATPSEYREDLAPQSKPGQILLDSPSESASAKSTTKKKAATRKPAAPKAKAKPAPKLVSVFQCSFLITDSLHRARSNLLPILADDSGMLSEGR